MLTCLGEDFILPVGPWFDGCHALTRHNKQVVYPLATRHHPPPFAMDLGGQ